MKKGIRKTITAICSGCNAIFKLTNRTMRDDCIYCHKHLLFENIDG